jgi:hypothetical protein
LGSTPLPCCCSTGGTAAAASSSTDTLLPLPTLLLRLSPASLGPNSTINRRCCCCWAQCWLSLLSAASKELKGLPKAVAAAGRGGCRLLLLPLLPLAAVAAVLPLLLAAASDWRSE